MKREQATVKLGKIIHVLASSTQTSYVLLVQEDMDTNKECHAAKGKQTLTCFRHNFNLSIYFYLAANIIIMKGNLSSYLG